MRLGIKRSVWTAVGAALASLVLVAGCNGSAASPSPSESTGAAADYTVIATTSVFADLAQLALGDNVTIETIIPAGVDVHTFEPSPADAQKLAGADLILMNGLGLDEWALSLLEAAGKSEEDVLELAEGIDALVLDVKVGRGAFMKTESDARELGRCLVRVGALAGKRVSALLTDMNTPIGYTIGNALETTEALGVLHGQGPNDLRELTYALGAEMLRIAGVTKSKAQAMRRIERVIQDGKALEKMKQIVRAQGGDPSVVDAPDQLPVARYHSTVTALAGGYVTDIDPLELGYASVGLGAGRRRTEEAVDPGAGIRLHVQVGDEVRAGDDLVTLYASERALLGSAELRLVDAIRIGKRRTPVRSRIIGMIRR